MARRKKEQSRFSKLNTDLGSAAHRQRCPGCMQWITEKEIRSHKRYGCGSFNTPHVYMREAVDDD